MTGHVLLCVRRNSRSTAWELHMTSSRLLVCIFLTKLPETGWQEGLMSFSGTWAHGSVLYSSVGIYKRTPDWRVCHRHAVLFTDYNRFTMCTHDRRGRIWRWSWWTSSSMTSLEVSDDLERHILVESHRPPCHPCHSRHFSIFNRCWGIWFSIIEDQLMYLKLKYVHIS